MSFMHRYCCCGPTCPTIASAECVDCEDAVAAEFSLTSSGITMCPCILPPGGGNYGDYSGLPANDTYVVPFDSINTIVGDCQWFNKFGDASPTNFPFYANSDCTNFQGNLGGRIIWIIQRTATKWLVEGHIDVGAGSSRNWYGIFFSGERDVDPGDCTGPAGSFTNTLGSCGDIVTTGQLFVAGGELVGFTEYCVVGTGGTVTIVCYDP